MSLRTTKQKAGFFGAIGIGTAVGNIVSREMWESQSTLVSIAVGSLIGAISALFVVGIFALFAKKGTD